MLLWENNQPRDGVIWLHYYYYLIIFTLKFFFFLTASPEVVFYSCNAALEAHLCILRGKKDY